MVTIFYKAGGSIVNEIDEDLLPEIDYEHLLWVDLVNPTEEQIDKVERFFDVNLQTRQQAEEIESSSRFSETEHLIVANSRFLIPRDDIYVSEPASFLLKDGVLISHRNEELRSFGDTMRKITYNSRAYPTGFHVMVALFETRIDLDADMLEQIAREIKMLSSRINLAEDDELDKDLLLFINSLQENTMQIRENIIDKQRILSGVLKSQRFPSDLMPRLNIMIKDTNSLISFSDFGFDRLDFLQDTFLGLQNTKLNKVTKTFTVVSVIFMPPTLIASIYGMNFYMPHIDWASGYPYAMFVMLLASLITLIVFKIKKLL